METQPQNRRPGGGAFKQQRLKAWQPILTPKNVIPTLICGGLIFIPIGIILLVFSNQVIEVEKEYSNVEFCDFEVGNVTSCTVNIEVEETMKQPVYMYYKLTNFHQNHRRYVQSRSDKQLKGEDVSWSDLEECDPLKAVDGQNNESLWYNPCGLIAYSMFNDTFSLATNDGEEINLDGKGISWESDREGKFKNPSQSYGTRPPYWPPGVDDVENEDFIVWMRVAGLPTFRKLYRKINQDLSPGIYQLTVNNRFPVSAFGGSKSIVLSTTEWTGGKNPFLGIAYILLGSLCCILGIIFLFKHKTSPRHLADPQYLKWD
eukprot:GCRY01000606.1.p1 GENE.GCRY01000606.1~~GCRY01000606.1.p1  ORF type:complete len:317 (+),score=16.46 GCRY01000606.1:239-1189(+)